MESINIYKKPLVIAGPCSAESLDQLLETGTELAKSGKVDIIRAGLWKPRTRPNSFEGVGALGLNWLKRLKEETGLPVAVEVAKSSHVEQCLLHEIDVFWIGARTTVNPFAVQELAEALRGVKIPIFIKNPVNPDIALWLGAVERMEKVGINDIGVIHRGFSNYGEKYFRNSPQWQIPIEFRRVRTNVPMIVDPSHICGRRDTLKEVTQKAMDLNFDGMMIECHREPDNAWSDAQQQITPIGFRKLIDSIVFRDYNPLEDKESNELNKFREQIDTIDEELIHLLSNRMKIARSIGLYKRQNNITILQSLRWSNILKKFIAKAENTGLSERFIKSLIQAIHDESIDTQEEIITKNTIND